MPLCVKEQLWPLAFFLLSLYIKTPNRLFSLRNPVAVAWSHNKRSRGQRTNDKNPAPAKATSDNESGQMDGTLRGQCVLSKQTYNLWCKASRISLMFHDTYQSGIRVQLCLPSSWGSMFFFLGWFGWFRRWLQITLLTHRTPSWKNHLHTHKDAKNVHVPVRNVTEIYWREKEKKKYFHLWTVPSPGRESRSNF